MDLQQKQQFSCYPSWQNTARPSWWPACADWEASWKLNAANVNRAKCRLTRSRASSEVGNYPQLPVNSRVLTKLKATLDPLTYSSIDRSVEGTMLPARKQPFTGVQSTGERYARWQCASFLPAVRTCLQVSSNEDREPLRQNWTDASDKKQQCSRGSERQSRRSVEQRGAHEPNEAHEAILQLGQVAKFTLLTFEERTRSNLVSWRPPVGSSTSWGGYHKARQARSPQQELYRMSVEVKMTELNAPDQLNVWSDQNL